MPSRRGETWQHEPTSTASQPDRVPSKSLPPLSSMDRMANGEHLGQCPTCGGHQWWDNRSRKAIGELSRSQPDYVCTDCRHGRWIDGRQRSGWAAPTGHRAPSVRVTVVAPVVEPANAVARGGSCASDEARRVTMPEWRNGRIAVLWTPFTQRRRRARAQSVPRHDQGWPAVPGWRCSWNPLLPATRTPTLTETVGSTRGRGRRRPVAGRLRRTTTCRSGALAARHRVVFGCCRSALAPNGTSGTPAGSADRVG